MPKVTFLPLCRSFEALPEESILDVAQRNGVSLPHACGGFCACTTCHVTIRSGIDQLSPIEECEEDRLERANPPATLLSRLGCQAKVTGDVVVEIVHDPKN